MPGRLPGSVQLVCVVAGVRAATVSLAGILIPFHFAERGLMAAEVGLVIGAGMAASTIGTLMVGLRADTWGRRRTLVTLATVTGLGYIAVAVLHDVTALIGVAAVTMFNGMGRDRGPISALEQALLPATTSDENRTWTLAAYNAAIDTGHSIGALGAAIPAALTRTLAVGPVQGRTLVLMLCGGAVLVSVAAYALLPGIVEPGVPTQGAARPSVDEPTRGVVRKLMLLFGLDSIGGGFLGSALIVFWFLERYGAAETEMAALFFVARMLNVVSHLAAAWLARRIGLLKTMVFTHLPSSVFLLVAPAAPTFALAATLFLAREALVEMDVPTRQSYTMAVVPREARTYASGLTNVTRTAGWAVGQLVGGAMMQSVNIAAPLVAGAGLKIVYDVVLYRSFRHLRPPEERSGDGRD